MFRRCSGAACDDDDGRVHLRMTDDRVQLRRIVTPVLLSSECHADMCVAPSCSDPVHVYGYEPAFFDLKLK